LGEFNRLGDFLLHFRTYRLDLGIVDEAIGFKIGLEMRDRIAIILPMLDFFLGAITVAVALGMPPDAVGLVFNQRWSVAAPCAFGGLADSLRHFRQIIAVDDHARHIIGRC